MNPAVTRRILSLAVASTVCTGAFAEDPAKPDAPTLEEMVVSGSREATPVSGRLPAEKLEYWITEQYRPPR